MHDLLHEFLRENPLILLLGVIVVLIAVKKTVDLFFRGDPAVAYGSLHGISVIPVLSGIVLAVTFLKCSWGIFMSHTALGTWESIDISPNIVAGGIEISLFRILTSLAFFLFSLVIWFALRTRYNALFRRQS